MKPKAILQAFFGLFVDDGSLAINLLVWSAIAGVVLPRLSAGETWPAPLLFAGYLLILLENVIRAARNG